LINAGYLQSRAGEQGKRLLYISEVNSKIGAIPTKSDIPPAPEKEPEATIPEDKPINNKEDAATLFQKAREFWNDKGLKPECRDLMMRCGDTPDILKTFQHYSWEEIRNAIGNYYWHKTQAGPGYISPLPFGSLGGFLKTGVERYYDDDALDQQFKKEPNR